MEKDLSYPSLLRYLDPFFEKITSQFDLHHGLADNALF